jgi:hypothetical protein
MLKRDATFTSHICHMLQRWFKVLEKYKSNFMRPDDKLIGQKQGK